MTRSRLDSAYCWRSVEELHNTSAPVSTSPRASFVDFPDVCEPMLGNLTLSLSLLTNSVGDASQSRASSNESSDEFQLPRPRWANTLFYTTVDFGWKF